MRADTRLSRMVHILLHMASSSQQLTAQQIAEMLDTNATVVRRTMAGLRKAGYVSSNKGHGGGWTVIGDLSAVTLLDINLAIGDSGEFTMGFDSENPICVVERAVNMAINAALRYAERLLRDRLAAITLGQLAQHLDGRCVFEH
nr:Rrf2 family transcriptional regulator [Comamonas koreensis]